MLLLCILVTAVYPYLSLVASFPTWEDLVANPRWKQGLFHDVFRPDFVDELWAKELLQTVIDKNIQVTDVKDTKRQIKGDDLNQLHSLIDNQWMVYIGNPILSIEQNITRSSYTKDLYPDSSDNLNDNTEEVMSNQITSVTLAIHKFIDTLVYVYNELSKVDNIELEYVTGGLFKQLDNIQTKLKTWIKHFKVRKQRKI